MSQFNMTVQEPDKRSKKGSLVTGLFLRGDWDGCLQGIIDFVRANIPDPKPNKPLLEIKMPCGKKLIFKTYKSLREMPHEDVPCTCGDPTHWFVKHHREGCSCSACT